MTEFSAFKKRVIQVVAPEKQRKKKSAPSADHFELPEALLEDVQRIADQVNQNILLKNAQLIGVTSAAPGEGTSTMAALLALMLSTRKRVGPVQIGPGKEELGRVLLVDANLRRPALHRMFEVEVEAGLADWLDGEVSVGTSLLSEIIDRDLMLLNAGSSPDELAALHIDFERCANIFAQLKSQFSYVIVDLPPLLHATESRSLSQLCDGVVMVVQSGKTRRGVVEAAAQTLAQANCPLLGTILNQRKFYIPSSLYRRL